MKFSAHKASAREGVKKVAGDSVVWGEGRKRRRRNYVVGPNKKIRADQDKEGILAKRADGSRGLCDKKVTCEYENRIEGS